ncbi:MAG: glycoside hydrolase family 127 protein [Sedimentisphaerales bacterium]|nr:glycoside hydrolase family 127 protein [Sedimentisphaerales bacterium]
MEQRVFTIVLLGMLCSFPVLGERHDAAVGAFEEKLVLAQPLPLSSVRLTGGPLKQAQDVTAEYLLTLEPDRMMAGYRLRAGLEPKAEGYGGWDAVDSRQLTGHIAGHYLSGISYMYAATGDERFKQRADYLVREMKEVQDKRGNGYLGAIIDRNGTDGAEIMRQVSEGNIRSGGFDLNGLWSPWYTLHKTYAGLRDAYRYTGNKTALEVEIKFAEWAASILDPMSDEQIQRMLNTEFGGMNEIMADLYADTGDKRWLELSYKFEHERMLEPLKRHIDNLSGVHGNTTIPKLIGSADRFGYIGRAEDIMAAGFFFDQVVHHHTFATGGNSIGENFPQTDQLAASMGSRGNETCNTYNMRKLTQRLFQFYPDAHYADFLERATFNHMLGAIDLESAAVCYMVPVGGSGREYQNMYRSFTCCSGTGMESHALHADGAYYEMDNKLWVNLYAPSTVDWRSQGAKLDVATDFPLGETVTIKVNLSEPKELTLALRKPYWAGDGFVAKVNGQVVAEQPAEAPTGMRGGRGGQGARAGQRRGFGRGGVSRPPVSSYVDLTRTWRDGDTVELTVPKTLRTEPTLDDANRMAIMWGPLVLAPQADEMMAGDENQRQQGRRGGRRGRGSSAGLPVIVTEAESVSDWLKPVSGEPGTFIAAGVGHRATNPQQTYDVRFVPFYASHQQASFAYVDVLSPDEWAIRVETVTEEQRQRQLDAITVGYADAGEMQGERDTNYQSSTERAVQSLGVRHGRAGTGWFSFDLPIEADEPMALLVTLNSSQQDGASFEIQADGTCVATQSVVDRAAEGFYDVRIPLPGNLTEGKETVTVRFQSTGDGRIPTIFGVRTVRANPQP